MHDHGQGATSGSSMYHSDVTRPLIIAFALAGTVVWAFAIIGLFSVADAVGSNSASATPERRLIASAPIEAAGRDIEGLPPYPDADRSDYSRSQHGRSVITEVEYVVATDSGPVRDYYRDVFDDESWNVVDSSLVRGEWVYTITGEGRRAVVEIEQLDGYTEVEIELSEPAFDRGQTTGR